MKMEKQKYITLKKKKHDTAKEKEVNITFPI